MSSNDNKGVGLGEVKHGRDEKLEADADEWLSRGVGDNERSDERTLEKLLYDLGRLSREDLQLHNPDYDWDTQYSAFALTVSPADLVTLEPSIGDVGDGNIRARNPRSAARRALMRHIDDEGGWGSAAADEIPPLGLNKGDRKTCTKCKKAKGLDYFYAHPKTRDGLQSQCKACQRGLK
ncbi:hypothetical protein SEA_KALAH2_158 [Mycobacterium phage Kalah2]|nr:hypothetical protein SEA_KALAH2_158 [Mycobacterium phage Kalah2]